MQYVRDLWGYSWNSIVDITTTNSMISINLIELLPIEMINLCDSASFCDPWLLLKYNNKGDAYWFRIYNKGITKEWVLRHPDFRLDLSQIPEFKNDQSIEYLEFYQNTRIASVDIDNHRIYSQDPFFTPEIITKYSYYPWNWHSISKNPSITHEFVNANISKPWDPYCLAKNPAIDPERILKDHGDKHGLSFIGFSENPNITTEFVAQHLYEPWSWSGLARNSSVDPEFIINILKYKWKAISSNTSLRLEFVAQNLEKPWDWSKLSANPAITAEFISNHIAFENGSKIPWNWRAISSNPSITPDFVLKYYANNKFSWKALSKNQAMTPEFIFESQYLPWELDVVISHNENINLEFILIYHNWTYHSRFGYYLLLQNKAIFIF